MRGISRGVQRRKCGLRRDDRLMSTEMEGQQNGVRGAVEWRGGGHRLMMASREVERPVTEKSRARQSRRYVPAPQNKPLFHFQVCKYEQWNDVVCKKKKEKENARTLIYLRFIKVISCHSFIFRVIEAEFE